MKAISGMKDLLPLDSATWQFVEKTCREHFALYQFAEIRTPLLENTELFVRSIGTETGVVQKEMYTFDDKGGDSVTLRPEGTASVVRAYVEHNIQAQDPITKLYYMGPMFRYERPQKGRLRQFHQIGCELLGAGGPMADAEMIALLYSLIQKLKIESYRLEINSLGCMKDECRPRYLTDIKTFFAQTASQFCTECQRKIEKNPMRVFDCKNPTCKELSAKAPKVLDFLCGECLPHWTEVKAGLDRLNVKYTINPRIVRGLDYYNRTAFELISDQLGSQSAFAGGGRYDSLVAEMGGPSTPAVGFAIGMERLTMLLSPQTAKAASKKVFIAFMGEAARLKSQELAQNLRLKNVSVEMAYEEKSLKSQMRHADKIGCSHVVILGDNEITSGKVMVKNFAEKTQNEIPLNDLVRYFLE